jgi:formylglycine-generating enzyme required for sulfatase activity
MYKCKRSMIGLVCLVVTLSVLHQSISAITIDMVPVGNPGNAPDKYYSNSNPGHLQFGAVAYDYRIGTYEVTNDQYVEFLNAKAASDPLLLFNATTGTGGITRSGTNGNYSYASKIGWGNKPVNWISWYDAIRFANWFNNGQGSGDTESGAYTLGLLGAGGIPVNGLSITRNPGAKWFLPSEDEWYKAAYYDGVTGNYFQYPTGSNTAPTNEPPPGGANSANYDGGPQRDLTNVGAYTATMSPYGPFDMAGNVWEFNESLIYGMYRVFRGGTFQSSFSGYLLSSFRNYDDPSSKASDYGIRLASIPGPDGIGDFNHNGTVDAADYVVWRKTGINGQQGYNDWRSHFGQPAGSGSGAIANATVPEPSTLLLAITAFATLLTVRRR